MNPDSQLAEQFGQLYGNRREWREYTTQEIQIRSTHKRRRFVARGGVLVAFALAMVVYPIVGTIVPSTVDIEAVPGAVLGDAPSSIAVALGDAPELTSSELPRPSVHDTTRSIVTNLEYTVSARLPSCDGSTVWKGANGNLTEDSLCYLWDGRNQIRSDAAVALAELNHQYRLRFGEPICVISSYRTYYEQVRIKFQKGWKAATPGQSYHGWGLAIDLCRPQDLGESYDWLRENAPAYGWDNPRWAYTIKYEPWHWEYVPGTNEIGWYVSDETIDAELAEQEAAAAAAAAAEAAEAEVAEESEDFTVTE